MFSPKLSTNFMSRITYMCACFPIINGLYIYFDVDMDLSLQTELFLKFKQFVFSSTLHSVHLDT